MRIHLVLSAALMVFASTCASAQASLEVYDAKAAVSNTSLDRHDSAEERHHYVAFLSNRPVEASNIHVQLSDPVNVTIIGARFFQRQRPDGRWAVVVDVLRKPTKPGVPSSVGCMVNMVWSTAALLQSVRPVSAENPNSSEMHYPAHIDGGFFSVVAPKKASIGTLVQNLDLMGDFTYTPLSVIQPFDKTAWTGPNDAFLYDASHLPGLVHVYTVEAQLKHGGYISFLNMDVQPSEWNALPITLAEPAAK